MFIMLLDVGARLWHIQTCEQKCQLYSSFDYINSSQIVFYECGKCLTDCENRDIVTDTWKNCIKQSWTNIFTNTRLMCMWISKVEEIRV